MAGLQNVSHMWSNRLACADEGDSQQEEEEEGEEVKAVRHVA
jgi:hypothetical protein